MTNDATAAPPPAVSDTSVLLDFALDGFEDAQTYFWECDSEKLVTVSVHQEFTDVAERRRDIHRALLDVFTVSQDGASIDEVSLDALDVQLVGNDDRYLRSLLWDLQDFDSRSEVLRRLNELIRQLRRRSEALFSQDDPLITRVVDDLSTDDKLWNRLRPVIENPDDVRIVCEVVSWCQNGGSGVFLTSDYEDLIGVEQDDDSQEEAASDELPDSFLEFAGGDTRTQRERINDHIEQRFDSNATLAILSVDEYLELHTDA